GQRLGAQRVERRNGEQGGPHPVATDVQQVDGEMSRVYPMVPEGVPAQLLARLEAPLRFDTAKEGRRQYGADIRSGFAELAGQVFLASLQRFMRGLFFVAQPFLLQAGADACPQENRV